MAAMARKPRIGLPGIPQHVVQRGNNRQPCFHNELDCLRFLKILKAGLARSRCQLHAFVLMTNHVHMLVTPEEANGVSLLMRDLGRAYVRYFNDTYHRSGTLWEGRYNSSLIDSDRYCLICYRYIELNPVRARLVSDPAEYPWSSYHVNARGKKCDLITPHELWVALGSSESERQSVYRGLFIGQLNNSDVKAIRGGSKKNRPVGDARFQEQIEQTTGINLGTGKRGRPSKEAG